MLKVPDCAYCIPGKQLGHAEDEMSKNKTGGNLDRPLCRSDRLDEIASVGAHNRQAVMRIWIAIIQFHCTPPGLAAFCDVLVGLLTPSQRDSTRLRR